ncbi:inactive glycosyltransferase 25 family member 3 isoform X5 [Mustela putorius furo]|uniref:Inactive glycosyltransferase 25 family member 3 isoform X5 n=1 Tax=Mustela putorius furo TaxID=9669 RepID=A0A8U0V3I9_MUSPF|nr:inactive glycosyltransferase 25 family member 3 isoform X5 [Mustela putorius furo]XP_044938444.1 inactive glycosyltransferase 25 family member 3 isoform X5 [Mustela putorius furo]XP_044938445.1 inactive glycosyltransferase 25 family member 3 isoform X5 [Mustela putorius furo]XP_044938446.1 inactive glycosyltransferase 25 family member 3 isoform X5 [Mustela putorius furo]XP_044938447.1 inactive glycosyltransferase 25 family member 3 isoform X5 [Mustela putorius furo]
MPLQGCLVTRLHAERSFECIHSFPASLQTHPQMRTRGSGKVASLRSQQAGAAPALTAEERRTTRGGRRPRDQSGWRAEVLEDPHLPPPPWGVTAQVCEVPRPWSQAEDVVEPPLPAVVLTILARNAEHSLPHYLGALERLDYPRARLALWCATDHNTDNSTQMLQEWLAAVGDDYAAVVWRPEGDPRSYPDEEGPKHWTKERHQFLMELKQEALTFARDWGADYILFADTDNILTNNQTLRLLIEQGLPVVAPMLDSQTYYSNFWCGITPQGYYRRTADYFPTKNRQRRGCFRVPMVHSTFLVSLRAEGAAQLAFYPPHPNYTWPFDDIIVFAYACQAAGVTVHVCNEHRYGYMNVPVKSHQGLEDEKVNFIHLILEALVDGPPMQASGHVSRPPKRPSKMGFDEVFVISLARRPDRRERMLSSLWEMEISGRVVEAVDGRTLNSSIMRNLGVDLLPGYQDPYSGRTLTKGEVGCFLSHYSIWEEVAARGLAQVLVFEDDVRFESNFRGRLERLMEEVEAEKLPWDLIYLGRKQVNPEEEAAVERLPHLVVAGYSYWTLAYVLSLAGARKLLASQPLRRMLPVDEFLPIMFDRHPNEQYKAHFWPRDLRAFSARPLLAAPTHYAGDAEWLSDTETSSPWDDDSGRIVSWSGSHKTLRDPRLDLAGSSGHSLPTPPHPRDEL